MEPSPAPEPDAPTLDAPHRGTLAETQWLVHCSPERTLVARRNKTGTGIVKSCEQGSLVDAEQEAELAKSLAGPGVVT